MDLNTYNEKFNTETYLRSRFSDINEYKAVIPLQQFHEFFNKHYDGHEDLKVLDYGSGPAIAYAISAAKYAEEIVFSDYTENNRRAIMQWVDKDPGAFDWSHFFEHVVESLEKKTKEEAKQRQEKMRNAVKGVASCDILASNPIEKGYEGPYDVIVTCVCLEPACSTKEEYVAAVGKLKAMLKPGGRLAMYSTDRDDDDVAYYFVGDEKFTDVAISREFLAATLRGHGFSEVTLKKFEVPADAVKISNLKGMTFATARNLN